MSVLMNKTGYGIKTTLRIRTGAALTAVLFTANLLFSNGIADGFAASEALPLSSIGIPETIEVPKDLGTVETFYRIDSEKPLVLVIRDAHGLADAQDKIEKLIRYFGETYGVRRVGVEGGKGDLDPTLFRSFPDERIKRRVLSEYLERGEITGVEMSAVFNPENLVYTGLEDWALYEADFDAYRKAAEKTGSLLNELKKAREGLNREKEESASPEFGAFLNEAERFRGNQTSLIDFVNYLRGIPDLRGGIASRSEVAKLARAIETEALLDGAAIEGKIREAAEAFRQNGLRRMPKDRVIEFNGKYQAFQTGGMDGTAFLRFMTEFACEAGADMRLPPELDDFLSYANALHSMKGSKLFDQLGELIADGGRMLASSDAERNLFERYGRLNLLSDLVCLKADAKQLDAYHETPDRYREFFGNPGDLDPALDFYRIASEREEAICGNLERLIRRENQKISLVVIGGLHSRGLEAKLKEKNVSYAMITPSVLSMKGDGVYERVMGGELSYRDELRTTFYDGFARKVSRQFADELAQEEFPGMLRLWRDNILNRLRGREDVNTAREYTRYVDSLVPLYFEKFEMSDGPSMRERVREAIGKESDEFAADYFNGVWRGFNRRIEDFKEENNPVPGDKIPEGQRNPAGNSNMVQIVARPAMTPGLRVSGGIMGFFKSGGVSPVSGGELFKAASLGTSGEGSGMAVDFRLDPGIDQISFHDRRTQKTIKTYQFRYSDEKIEISNPENSNDFLLLSRKSLFENVRREVYSYERLREDIFVIPYFVYGVGDYLRQMAAMRQIRREHPDRYISIFAFDNPANRELMEVQLKGVVDEVIWITEDRPAWGGFVLDDRSPAVPSYGVFAPDGLSVNWPFMRSPRRVSAELLVRQYVKHLDREGTGVRKIFQPMNDFDYRTFGVETEFLNDYLHEGVKIEFEVSPEGKLLADLFYRGIDWDPGREIIAAFALRLDPKGLEARRRNSDVPQVIRLAKYLRSRGVKILFFGESIAEHAPEIMEAFANDTGVFDMTKKFATASLPYGYDAAVLSRATFAVGMNTGNLDLALATGIPGIRYGEYHYPAFNASLVGDYTINLMGVRGEDQVLRNSDESILGAIDDMMAYVKSRRESDVPRQARYERRFDDPLRLSGYVEHRVAATGSPEIAKISRPLMLGALRKNGIQMPDRIFWEISGTDTRNILDLYLEGTFSGQKARAVLQIGLGMVQRDEDVPYLILADADDAGPLVAEAGEAEYFRRAEAIFVASEEQANLLREKYSVRNTIVVYTGGITDGPVSKSKKTTGKKIIFVGHYLLDRAVVAVGALIKLSRKDDRYQLEVITNLPAKWPKRRFPGISFTNIDSLTPQEIARRIRDSDLFILPTSKDVEISPYAITAQENGVPVISSSGKAAHELLTGWEASGRFVFPERDKAPSLMVAFAKAISHLLSVRGRPVYETLRRNGLLNAKFNYNYGNAAGRVIKGIYLFLSGSVLNQTGGHGKSRGREGRPEETGRESAGSLGSASANSLGAELPAQARNWASMRNNPFFALTGLTPDEAVEDIRTKGFETARQSWVRSGNGVLGGMRAGWERSLRDFVSAAVDRQKSLTDVFRPGFDEILREENPLGMDAYSLSKLAGRVRMGTGAALAGEAFSRDLLPGSSIPSSFVEQSISENARALLARPGILIPALERWIQNRGFPAGESFLSDSPYILDAVFLEGLDEAARREFAGKMTAEGRLLGIAYKTGTPSEKIAVQLGRSVRGVVLFPYHKNRVLQQRHLIGRGFKNPILVFSPGTLFNLQAGTEGEDWEKRGLIAEASLLNAAQLELGEFLRVVELILGADYLRSQLEEDRFSSFPRLDYEGFASIMGFLNRLAESLEVRQALARSA